MSKCKTCLREFTQGTTTYAAGFCSKQCVRDYEVMALRGANTELKKEKRMLCKTVEAQATELQFKRKNAAVIEALLEALNDIANLGYSSAAINGGAQAAIDIAVEAITKAKGEK